MSQKILNGLDMTGTPISNLPTPVSTDQPATMGYVDTIFGGWAFKDNVRAASTGNVNLASPGANIDGVALAAGDRVLLKDQTSQPANGIYIWNGAAVAMTRATDADAAVELESAKVTVDEGATNANTDWRQTSLNFVIGVGNVIWTSDNNSTPAASETVAGKAELATQAEADAGTDDLRIMTPLKVANLSGRMRRATGNVGDNSSTQYDISHNFNTRNVEVEVYRNSTPWDTVQPDVSRPDANTVRFNFAVAPTTNQFSYVIFG